MTEANDRVAKRRPWHLWVVGILALLWTSLGALDFVMTQTTNEAYLGSFTPEQLEYVYGIPAFMVALWAIVAVLGPCGAILLLLKKKQAFPVFAAWLAGGVITAIYSFGLSKGLEILGPAALVMTIVAFVIGVLLVVYARAMTARGVLT